MIRVTIEFLPRERGVREVVAVLDIANTGEGTPESGHYSYALSQLVEDAAFGARGTDGVWMRGQVGDFPRKRLGFVDLVYRALRVAVGRRSP